MATKGTITIKELADRAHAFAESCHDEFAPSNTFQLLEDNSLSFSIAEGVGMRENLLPLARSQMYDRFDAPPMRWIDDENHCPRNLRIDIMNTLFRSREQKDMLIRSRGDNIRAILSSTYSRLDHTALIDMMAEAVGYMGTNVEVHRPEVGDDMRAYVMMPDITFGQIGDNDRGTKQLHPAIYIRNSEVGRGSIGVFGGLYQGFCSNGTIYGWTIESDRSFTHRHAHITETAFKIWVYEALDVAMRMSKEAADMMLKSLDVHLKPQNLRNIVDGWIKQYGISVEAGENWMGALLAESANYGRSDDPRMIDAVNSATQIAQTRNEDEREQMERMAGAMLYSLSDSSKIDR